MTITTAAPLVITQEDYRSTWEPQGWQLLIIGPTSTWRQEWGEWEAIRDIVQNALDETEGYSFGWDSQGLWIADQGKGVAVADFLLGPPKLKPAWARGRFGEGMKIASLALLRKGYRVRVDTVGRELWLAFYKQAVGPGQYAEVLAALWRANGAKAGTRFHIIGYQGPAFDDRFAVNFPRQSILHQGPSRLHEPIRRWNQLIGEPFQGRIFARDIYLKDINSPWSYNLWSFEMAPDRHGPKSEADMWTDIGRTWATVTSIPLLERFLGMMRRPPVENTDENQHITMGGWMGKELVTGKDYNQFIAENGSAWREAWRRAIGEDAVLRTDSWWDSTVVHLGYVSVDMKWEVLDSLAEAIKTDTALVKESQERLREVQPIPDDSLTLGQQAHLRLARKIAASVLYSKLARVAAALIPPASDRTRTAGLYSRTTREVFISLEQLDRARTTVDTLIHELAHFTSNADDLTEAHSNEMTQLASRVVELTAAGRFDAELKEAAW